MSIALEPSCRNLHLPVQCFPQSWSFLRHFQTFQQIPFVTITIIIEFSNQNLFFIQVPSTEEEWINIAAQLNDLWNFPNCNGAMDGKHIQMRRPINSGSYYFNYKGFFSIVLLGLVDADYKFIYIDVGCNGRISDGGVYRNSSLSQALSENRLNVPAAQTVANSDVVLPYVIAADDAFPLKYHIMKPYPMRNLSKEQRIYNYRLSRARRIVENAFGILANRFRVFLSPILSPGNTEKIVLASCVLHNYLRTKSPKRYTPNGCIDTEDIRRYRH